MPKLPRVRLSKGLGLVVVSLLLVILLATLIFLNPEVKLPQPPYIVLVFDTSSSMAEPGITDVPRFKAAQDSANIMLNTFFRANPMPRIAVVGFDAEAQLLLPFSHDFYEIKSVVRQPRDLSDAPSDADIGAGLALALDQLEGHKDGYIILITDSAPTLGLPREDIIETIGHAAREDGHCFYTFGMGDYDASLLAGLRDVSPCESAAPLAEGVDDPLRLRGAFMTIGSLVKGYSVAVKSGRIEPGETSTVAVKISPLQERQYISLFPDTMPDGQFLEMLSFDPDGEQALRKRKVRGIVNSRIYKPDGGTWTFQLYNPTDKAISYIFTSYGQLKPTLQSISNVKVTIALGVGIVVLTLVWMSLAMRFDWWSWLRARFGATLPASEGALFNPTTGDRFVLGQDTDTVLYIGCAEDCVVRLDAAEPHHVAIHCGKQGRYFLQDLSGHTLLNGQPVRAVRLASGDKITIGETTLRFEQT